MARLSPSRIVKTLVEGGVNIFKPKGRPTPFYHVAFRVRDVTQKSGQRRVFRSCGTEDRELADIRASEIFLEEVSKKKAPAKSTAANIDIQSNAISPVQPSIDPTITEVTALHKEWMASAQPGESRPQLGTVTVYYNRLKQLCRLLGVETVNGLSIAAQGLKPHKIGVSEENFVPLMRCAAGIFRRTPMEYYAKNGVRFDAPLRSGPPVRINQFTTPPTLEQIEKLKDAARNQLKTAFRNDYLAFLLILNAGLRAQEAAHVRWKDIDTRGVWVRAEAGRCRARPERERYGPKSKKDRHVPVDPHVLAELEGCRKLPLSFVVEDGVGPGKVKDYVAKTRCTRVFRRLSKWLKKTLPELLPDVRNPNHWLRKVFGSVVAQEVNLETAGEYLGHAKGSPVTGQTYHALLKRPAVRIGQALPTTEVRSAS